MAPPNGVNAAVRERPNARPPAQPPALTLALYPGILIIGSLYSLISPTAQPPATQNLAANGMGTEETHDTGPINYFARKGNIFNVYFVKIGWLWTTAAFLSLLWVSPAFNSTRIDRDVRLRRVWQALLRYLLVTVSWILTTQWCFGPAIIDRSFIATGGRCHSPHSAEESTVESMLTAVACKASGGSWKGGHDVSGHAFMLVVASAFLVFELAGSLWPVYDNPEIKDKSEETLARNQNATHTQDQTTRWTRNFVLGVIIMSLWMLLMTGIWFHTWLEKMSGLILAFGTVYAVHVLPRTFEPWGSIVGTPGV